MALQGFGSAACLMCGSIPGHKISTQCSGLASVRGICTPFPGAKGGLLNMSGGLLHNVSKCFLTPEHLSRWCACACQQWNEA